MVTCFICKHDGFRCVQDLYKHFKEMHLLVRNSTYVCCENQCGRMFDDKYTFGRHVNTHHPDTLNCSESAPLELLRETLDGAQYIVASGSGSHSNNVGSVNELEDEERRIKAPKLLKDIAAKCLAECKSGTSTLQQAKLGTKCSTDLVDFIVTDIAADVVTWPVM